MFTAVLAAVLYVMSLGIGKHIARFLPVYLMLAMASLLPIFIYLSVPEFSDQSPISYFFLNLLGQEQAANAKLHILAIAGGFTHGFLLQILGKGKPTN